MRTSPALLACAMALAVSACATSAGSGLASAASALPRDPAQEAQIQAIVAHMTLAQKIGQMTQPEIHAITPAEVRQYAIGSVLNGGDSWPRRDKHASMADWLALADSWWDASMSTDMAVKIPVIWGTDAVHGNNNVAGMTLFPHNIGLGAAGDPALVERIGQAAAAQVRASGIDWTFAPTVAVVRNDRWGRTYEGFSEDPAIVAAYASRYVTGLQGTNNTNADFPHADSVLAGVREVVGDANVTYAIDAQGVDVRSFQAVIAVIGETPYAEGAGDIRRSDTLEHARRHPEDLAVLDRVSGQGVPVVTVLLSGRPLWVNREINRSDAFVAAWLPGTEGKGIADMLFRPADGGARDFSGRLSYSWPLTACQVAMNKGDTDYAPLFAYGYGLTYAGTHPSMCRLDESPQPQRCGAPTEAAGDELVERSSVPFRPRGPGAGPTGDPSP